MLFYNEKIWKRCFNWRGRYWYKNIKEIPLYFRLIHHLIKYGYDEYATWETFDWFISTMKDILTYYRNHHQGYPVSSNFNDMFDEELASEYDKDLDKMIYHLHYMDEHNVEDELSQGMPEDWIPNTITVYEIMERHKDEFFKLFSKYFYNLWD